MQYRGVPDCHRRLENTVELERSPGELNRVAESNCACEAEQKKKKNIGFSSRPSSRGRFSPSPEKDQTPTSLGCPCQGRFVNFLGRLGAWLGRGGRRSPARGSTRRPRCRFSLGQSSSRGRRRAPMVTGRLRPGPGGSGGRCITLGLDVLDRLCLLLYR